jgi:hypothetical protein
MVEELKGILGIEEVQEVVREFISTRYSGAMASFSEISLTAVGGMNVFEVKGEISGVGGVEILGRPPVRKFVLQVHPTQKKVVGYKIK